MALFEVGTSFIVFQRQVVWFAARTTISELLLLPVSLPPFCALEIFIWQALLASEVELVIWAWA